VQSISQDNDKSSGRQMGRNPGQHKQGVKFFHFLGIRYHVYHRKSYSSTRYKSTFI